MRNGMNILLMKMDFHHFGKSKVVCVCGNKKTVGQVTDRELIMSDRVSFRYLFCSSIIHSFAHISV